MTDILMGFVIFGVGIALVYALVIIAQNILDPPNDFDDWD